MKGTVRWPIEPFNTPKHGACSIELVFMQSCDDACAIEKTNRNDNSISHRISIINADAGAPACGNIACSCARPGARSVLLSKCVVFIPNTSVLLQSVWWPERLGYINLVTTPDADETELSYWRKFEKHGCCNTSEVQGWKSVLKEFRDRDEDLHILRGA